MEPFGSNLPRPQNQEGRQSSSSSLKLRHTVSCQEPRSPSIKSKQIIWLSPSYLNGGASLSCWPCTAYPSSTSGGLCTTKRNAPHQMRRPKETWIIHMLRPLLRCGLASPYKNRRLQQLPHLLCHTIRNSTTSLWSFPSSSFVAFLPPWNVGPMNPKAAWGTHQEVEPRRSCQDGNWGGGCYEL